MFRSSEIVYVKFQSLWRIDGGPSWSGKSIPCVGLLYHITLRYSCCAQCMLLNPMRDSAASLRPNRAPCVAAAFSRPKHASV